MAALHRLIERVEAIDDTLQRLNHPTADRQALGAAIAAARTVVREHVPRDAPLLLAGSGELTPLDLPDHSVRRFPGVAAGDHDRDGFPLGSAQAAIARLEVLRGDGAQFLLLAPHTTWWLTHGAGFAEHIATRYTVVSDEAESGVLIDLRAPPRSAERLPPLSTTLAELAAVSDGALSVLDWTTLGLRRQVPHANVFAPESNGPMDDESLPYLDRSFDVVVIEDAGRTGEAERLADGAVVTVAASPAGPAVPTAVRPCGRSLRRAQVPVMVIRLADEADERDDIRLREALEDERAELVDAGEIDRVSEDTIVALLDPGVLPLPGAVTAARATFARDERVGALAAKLLAADGSLAAAGVTLFSDGSHAGIAAGQSDVVAPWHEYVRDTCWGLGLTFFRPAGPDVIAALPVTLGAHAAWAAAAWSGGRTVRYQPIAVAVRTCPAPANQPLEAAWEARLNTRPRRPPHLNEAAWRDLLATDDVAGTWS